MSINCPQEERFNVRPIAIQYRCEFCNDGYMEAVDNEPVIIPAANIDHPQTIMRTHKCTKCGKTMQLPRTYPRIDWEITGRI